MSQPFSSARVSASASAAIEPVAKIAAADSEAGARLALGEHLGRDREHRGGEQRECRRTASTARSRRCGSRAPPGSRAARSRRSRPTGSAPRARCERPCARKPAPANSSGEDAAEREMRTGEHARGIGRDRRSAARGERGPLDVDAPSRRSPAPRARRRPAPPRRRLRSPRDRDGRDGEQREGGQRAAVVLARQHQHRGGEQDSRRARPTRAARSGLARRRVRRAGRTRSARRRARSRPRGRA